ncbi:MAG: response regulator [Gemmataceae bacterium]
MTGKRVLSVGQCLADNGSITRLLRTEFTADVLPLHSAHEALERLRRERFDLVLVNRVFDATGEGGLDLIRAVKADREIRDQPIMLVSNYPEPQAEAVAAGAVPGFGKDALHDPVTAEKLRPYLA